MTDFDEAKTNFEHAETDDDFPTGMLASPTRIQL